MSERRFHIVDVFAERPYSGNQLAVFLDGHLYTNDEMRALACEMNYSEVTFLLPQESRDGRYRARIFTPTRELPFAGHPTLGTAFIIATQIATDRPAEMTLDLPAGPIPVTIRYDAAGAVERLTMRQLQPAFGPVAAAPVVARMLGLPADLLDPRLPAQEVSTGLPFLIAPVRDLAAMRAIRLDAEAAPAALRGMAADGVLVFCRETEDAANGIHARVFVPDMGIAEDPATGSANGCLLAYLLQHEVLGAGPVNVRVEQGLEMGRPSVLYLNGRREAAGFTIEVGGKAQHIAEGRLRMGCAGPEARGGAPLRA